jgi:hypothetical protein
MNPFCRIEDLIAYLAVMLAMREFYLGVGGGAA